MLKKTITYTDYNGSERSEDFYFNLTKSELIEMETEVKGGFNNMLDEIIKSKDANKIMQTFKKLILQSYGEKSEDGRRFIKSKELSEAFYQTEAYNVLFLEVCTDADKASEFALGIVPSDLANQAKIEANNIMPKFEEVTED